MHADVPFVARAAKDVGVSARRVMALHDEHTFPAVAGEQCRGAKSANSGADYYRVVRAARVMAVVRFGDSTSGRHGSPLSTTPAARDAIFNGVGSRATMLSV